MSWKITSAFTIFLDIFLQCTNQPGLTQCSTPPIEKLKCTAKIQEHLLFNNKIRLHIAR